MMRLFFSGRSMTRPFFFGLFVMLDTLDLGKTKKQTRKKDHESSRFNADPTSLRSQYGHSQSEKKLGVGDKYHRSIKVHT